MIRALDIIISITVLTVLSPLILLVAIIGLFDTGSPFFLQIRMGKDKKKFTLLKFRTLKLSTKEMASHLIDDGSITRWGRFLRKSKFDEIPQFVNVLKKDMSVVGPRPCLFSQAQLIIEREKRGVLSYYPGITGLGQIHKIDMSTPVLLARLDSKMMSKYSLKLYVKVLCQTAFLWLPFIR